MWREVKMQNKKGKDLEVMWAIGLKGTGDTELVERQL